MSFSIRTAGIRARNCADCGEGCKIDVNDPCAACYRGVWDAKAKCQAAILPEPVTSPGRRPPLGLGDWVDVRAKPLARWIDARTRRLPRRYRTRLAGCSACSRRRGRLNRLVPDIRSWRGWLKLLRRA